MSATTDSLNPLLAAMERIGATLGRLEHSVQRLELLEQRAERLEREAADNGRELVLSSGIDYADVLRRLRNLGARIRYAERQQRDGKIVPDERLDGIEAEARSILQEVVSSVEPDAAQEDA